MGRLNYRYYDLVLGAFVTVLLCSNIIGAPKVARVFEFDFGAAIFFFPVSYIFGDILTEVYGYARTRRVVWSGFAALFFASLMAQFIVWLPPSPVWGEQELYEKVFAQTPRIALASLAGYWAGEFTNSYVMARMKVWMEGRALWMRTIGSTIVGQVADSLIFYPIAFGGGTVHGAAGQRYGGKLLNQSRSGDSLHPPHLSHREPSEKGGGGGLLRSQHRLQSIPPA